ncbi:hypothetical protein [Micromonospora sp. HM5-17]|uniref:hypothetical protein n=1 Tax=Micromonospora sp. HM5-17 TaxID=2487710 RepID=UPI000F4A0F62|nr:hypothetical protein [Micromonospora sp. HM5-17]ROT29640.1 hypothetical protein EF879_18515 [Micromonospora sp. HM5-17]
MSSTPKRPGPAAYISLGILIAAGFSPLAVHTITLIGGARLGRTLDFALLAALAVLLSAAGAYAAWLIIRHFRACQAEDRAAQQAEIDELTRRVEELEEQTWWGGGDSRTDPDADDTVELGPTVVPFRRRGHWAESRSS